MMPDLSGVQPTPQQQAIISHVVQIVRHGGTAYWSQGRAAGKTTLRALIAQAIIDDGQHDGLGDQDLGYAVVPTEDGS